MCVMATYVSCILIFCLFVLCVVCFRLAEEDHQHHQLRKLDCPHPGTLFTVLDKEIERYGTLKGKFSLFVVFHHFGLADDTHKDGFCGDVLPPTAITK